MSTIPPERWARMEELLDGALDRPAAERIAWLAQECADDLALRGAVERLLAAGAAPTRLPHPPADLVAPLLQELAAEAPDRVGPWRLLRELGHGGMGAVYLAKRDDDQFQKQAAVKLLHRGLAGDELTRRFRHERQILATLEHPHIARLLDGGIADGVPYIVMEYVDGLPLDEFCERHRLPVAERLVLFGDVCAAVQYAHQSLVVHRDLKPSNILVTADRQVKLLDFGIAKLLADEGHHVADAETRTGLRLMTPEYAAPEQVRGGRVTTATDVYALGVVLYELLAGRRPYDLRGRTPSEIERVICETEPVRPSTAAGAATGGDTQSLRRRLRGDLDTIVLKALRKEPGRRYPSAAALLEDLRRYRDGLPVLARPDSFTYRARKFAGRHRVGVAVTALALAGALAAAGRERALRAQAESERAKAEAESAKARAVQEFLVGVFGASDPYTGSAEASRELTAQRLLDRGRARVDSALGSEPEVQAEMRTVLGRVYANLGLYADAAPLLERALERRRALLGERHEAVAATATELGDVYLRQARYAEAESLLGAALATRRALHGAESEPAARSLDRLATVYQEQSRYGDAEPLFREALAIRRSRLGPDHADVAESLANLSLILWWLGRYEEADSLVERAVGIRRDRLGPRHALVAESMHNLAQVRQSRGRMEEAESLFRESLAMKREAFGSAHPRVTVHLNNYGRLLRDMGRYDEAEPLLQEALALDRRLFGEEHPYVAASLTNVALVQGDRGQLEQADTLFRQVLAMYRRLVGEKHLRVAFTLNNLATVRHRMGDLAGAERLFRESLAQYHELFGPEHRYTASVSASLAEVLRDRGGRGLAEAESLFRSAVRSLEAGMPETRGRLGPALAGLGQTLVAGGRPAEARPLLERGLELTRERYGDADWRTAEARLGLGACLMALGEEREGGELARRAREALEPFRRAQPLLLRRAESVR